MTVSSKHTKCNQVPSIISGSYSSSFYSTINFGSNHSGSSLHLNITNDVSSASLDKDRVNSDDIIYIYIYYIYIIYIYISDFHTWNNKLVYLCLFTISNNNGTIAVIFNRDTLST